MASALVRALALGLACALPAGIFADVAHAVPDQAVTNAAGQTFRVAAHRGGAGQWPENSMIAFAGAAEAGYAGIETDIVFTSDRVAVLSHYDKLPATCTMAGRRIHSLTFATVQQVRCADDGGAKTVPIATFAQLAELLQSHPSMVLHLDIKAYGGQRASDKRRYARDSVTLVKQYGLLDRTRFNSFNWDVALPAIRALAPQAYVLAYDHVRLNYDRVLLAKKLGANGYGTRGAYTTASFAAFVRSTGLDFVPWDSGAEQLRAMSIVYGPKDFWLMSDSPTALTDSLNAGRTVIDWAATDVTTTLATPKTVLKKKRLSARHNYYPPLIGSAIPETKRPALTTATLRVTISKGPGGNRLWVSARTDGSHVQMVSLPRGTTTLELKVPVGYAGKIRLRTAKKTTLTVAVTGYTNEVYTPATGTGG
jgi:glycerophosphoryl diester phosphodiesterase